MRLYTKLVPSALALVALCGCTGEISNGDGYGASPGSSGAPSGTGGTSGPGQGGSAAGPSTTGGTGVGNGGVGNGGTGVGNGGTPGAGTSSTGGSGAGTTGGTAGTQGAGAPLDLEGTPQYQRAIRLTKSQWARSVQDLLKLSAPSGLEVTFQDPVTTITDFSNNELVLGVDQRAHDDFEAAADKLATQVTQTDAALAKVYTGTDAAGFISTFGRRVYRRPLTSAEQSAYMTVYTSGTSLAGTQSAFTKGASAVIRAMLQSPYFLYRTELGAANSPLNGYEMAAKLSLWLRGTTPSDALLDSAAGPGKLDTAEGAAALATTMLGESTAAEVMARFHSELLHFERYDTISKINVPTYKDSLNDEYLQMSKLFFDKIYSQGLGVKEILTSTKGFVGPGTAAQYGIAAPANGFEERDLGAQRVGYFSQLPFLSLYAFNAEPDSIHRGVSINVDVLCAKLGPPAATIPPVPPLQPGQTNRQRISTLTAGCGGSCHNDQINPMGFAFEHFDGMGKYQDTENGGLTIDSNAKYTFADGSRSFSGAAELMQILATTPQTHTCYSKKLSEFAMQRDIVAKDMPLLTALTNVSMGASGSVKQVIIELVKNDAFRLRSGGTP
jgi:hypothetical protein